MPLAIEVTNLEEDVGNNGDVPRMMKLPNHTTEASHRFPNQEGLQATFMACSGRLAIAIEKIVSTNKNPLEGLWEGMETLPRFGLDFLAHYYAYLVENPHLATAFQVLEDAQKMVWVARYVKKTFPEGDDLGKMKKTDLIMSCLTCAIDVGQNINYCCTSF